MSLGALQSPLWLCLLAVTSTVVGTTTTQASPTVRGFPLENCKSANIDLVLVTDPRESPSMSSTREVTLFQLNFFKNLLNIFLNDEETELSRLRVAMVSAGINPFVFFQLGSESEKAGLEQAILSSAATFLNKKEHFQDEDNQTVAENTGMFINNSVFGSRGRKDAKFLVIWIFSKISGDNYYEFKYTANVFKPDQSGVMYFFIVPNYSTSGYFNFNNFDDIMSVASFSELQRNATIPMFLCGECYPGWTKFKPEVNQAAAISCYRMIDFKSSLDWQHASRLCAEYDGELLNVKSEEELRFLQPWLQVEIRQLFRKKRVQRSNSTAAVYIGLKRDWGKLDKRFRWSSGLPLVLTHWSKREPQGGYIRGCGMWTVENTAQNDEHNNSGSASWMEHTARGQDGWVGIGCGESATSLYACQVIPFRQFSSSDYSLYTPNISMELYFSTTDKGEFINASQIIRTISGIARVDKYVEQYEEALGLPAGSFLNHRFQCRPGANDYTGYSYVCDHKKDCDSGLDEEHCYYRICAQTEFTCRSKQCVPGNARCDMYEDCFDGSDEEACIDCNGYLCCDGSCLPRHWAMDGEIDCSGCDSNYNGFDDEDPENWDVADLECEIEGWPHNTRSVPCHVRYELSYKTFSELQSAVSCYNNAGQPVWAARCLKIRDKHGAEIGCRDMSHLRNCEKFECPEGYVKCPRSFCIPVQWRYDEIMDCAYGEDEIFENTYTEWLFHCGNAYTSLHPRFVCDGHRHCANGEDELNCNVRCGEGFLCLAGSVTVNGYDRSKPLTSLSFIDPRTRFIDLSGIDLSLVFPHDVEGILVNLFDIRFSNCRIVRVDSNSFPASAELITVFRMDLSKNWIDTVPAKSIFRFMKNLHDLNLSQNQRLRQISVDAFVSNDQTVLEHLDLSNTGLTALSRDTFSKLTNLKVLNLRHTQIKDISEPAFRRLTLDLLDLRDTPVTVFSELTFEALTISSKLYASTRGLCCPRIRGDIPERICKSSTDAISSCFDLLGQPVQRGVFWAVGVFAVSGNVVVILFRVLFDPAVLKKAYGIFVVNLCTADLLMGIYILIIAYADLYYRGNYIWNDHEWRHGALCKTSGFLSLLSSETSTFFSVLITVERFLVVKFPFGQLRFSKFATTVSCFVAWCLGAVVALLPVLPPFTHWEVYSTSSMCLALPLEVNANKEGTFGVVVFLGLNFFMFLLIAVGQWSIYVAMNQNKVGAFSSNQISARRAQDIEVAKQLLLVVMSDFLCWFPIGIMGILALHGLDVGVDSYAWSATLIVPVNSALNPLLYTIPVLLSKWRDFRAGRQAKDKKKQPDKASPGKKVMKMMQDVEKHVEMKEQQQSKEVENLLKKNSKTSAMPRRKNEPTNHKTAITLVTQTDQWSEGMGSLQELLKACSAERLKQVLQREEHQSVRALLSQLEKKLKEKQDFTLSQTSRTEY